MNLTIIKSAVAALAIAMSATVANAADTKPTHLVLLLDVSASNPLVASDEQAARIAGDVARSFPAMGEKSRISVMLFGDYDARRSVLRELPISVRFRPEAAKQSVVEMIRTIPKLVREGKLQIHKSTNLVGALIDVSRRVDCKAESTFIIAGTDGREDSADYGTMPPRKQTPIFAGCPELRFIGLNGTSPRHTQALEDAWRRWATEAGFVAFKAIR